MTGDLNAKQLAFIREYLECNEATKAAKSAGYSAKSAQVIGCQLLKHPKVAAEISRRRLPIQKKSALTAERVVQELSNIAFFDPATMYDGNGNLLNVKDMPEETRRAIAGVEHHLEKGTKLRLSSKLGSLELAAKLLGMVKEQQTQQQAVQIIIAAPPSQAQSIPGDVTIAKITPVWD